MSHKHQEYTGFAMGIGQVCGFALLVGIGLVGVSWIIYGLKILFASI
jgi:threonine/homoserine/homoserine lactone efflux protein